MSKVKLLTSDEKVHEVPREVACMSATIKNILEDVEDSDTPVPLPNITSKTLEKVIEYCDYHHSHPEEFTEEKGRPEPTFVYPWDAEFCKTDNATIFELILAANFLDIKPLLDLGCKTVATQIKGKTAEEIRQMFGIKNDFTPEEEAQVMSENEWCEN